MLLCQYRTLGDSCAIQIYSSYIFFLVCVCGTCKGGKHGWAGVHIAVWLNGSPEPLVILFPCWTPWFLRWSPPLKLLLSNWLGWLVETLSIFFSPPLQHWGCRCMLLCPAFYTDARDLNAKKTLCTPRHLSPKLWKLGNAKSMYWLRVCTMTYTCHLLPCPHLVEDYR